MALNSLKIYARSAALTIEPQSNRSRTFATIGIDAARKHSSGNTYEWANKVTVQVGERELPTVLAVLTGHLPECAFDYHGPARNKSYTLRAQAGGLLVAVSSAETGCISVPVERPDVFRFAALVLAQMQMNMQGLSGEDLLGLLGQCYQKSNSFNILG